MPWREIRPMDEKLQLISDWLSGKYSITELATSYLISRKTIYKWIERYQKYSVDGLKEQSRAPLHHPNQTSQEVLKLLIDFKLEHLKWGSKKLVTILSKKYPALEFPCASTAQTWLKRNGLVKKRKPRRTVPPYTKPFKGVNKSNASWSIDYKGQFKTKDGLYCYPLTIIDNYSRYLILCKSLISPNYEDTKRWVDWAFQEYGLPEAIRSDNGTPFAVASLTGLGRLTIDWVSLGIKHERIEKGHPEQNGRLERFHRTLKDDTTKPAKNNIYEQQQEFERYRQEYNEERPHESLGQITPSELYIKSTRKYPLHKAPPTYNSDLVVRKVKRFGEFSYRHYFYYLCQLLEGEYVGIREVNDNMLEVYYYDLLVAQINMKDGKCYGKKRKPLWGAVPLRSTAPQSKGQQNIVLAKKKAEINM